MSWKYSQNGSIRIAECTDSKSIVKRLESYHNEIGINVQVDCLASMFNSGYFEKLKMRIVPMVTISPNGTSFTFLCMSIFHLKDLCNEFNVAFEKLLPPNFALDEALRMLSASRTLTAKELSKFRFSPNP